MSDFNFYNIKTYNIKSNLKKSLKPCHYPYKYAPEFAFKSILPKNLSEPYPQQAVIAPPF